MTYITSHGLPWRRLSGKSILVTGATGMIPGYLVETLLFLNKTLPKMKMKIYGLARNRQKASLRYQDDLENKRLNLLIQDVSLPLKCRQRFDLIIHAASLASPIHFKSNPIGTIMPNVFGTCHLLEHAQKSKSELFLFISSPDVYGDTSEKSAISEDDYGYLDPLAQRSCYGESKRMGETLCLAWQNQNNIPVKIVRPFHVYGPGLNLDDGRVFSDFVSNVVRKQNILIKGQGNEYRTFCYLADAVLAIFTVLFFGRKGQAYNIGNDQGEIQIKKLAQLLVKLFPQYQLKVVFAQQRNKDYLKSPNKRGYPDTTKLKQLKWLPHYSLEEGFKRTIRSFLA